MQDGVARPLKTRIAPSNTAVSRLVEANRARFDSAATVPGAMERRVQALEAALAEAQADAALARHELAAIENATMWRATWPLRRALGALTAGRAPPPPVPVAAPAAVPPALTYPEWIRTEECARAEALMAAGPGHRPIHAQRLGLVVLGSAHAVDGIDAPEGCTVVALGPPDAPAATVARALREVECDLICFLDGQEPPGAARLGARGGDSGAISTNRPGVRRRRLAR